MHDFNRNRMSRRTFNGAFAGGTLIAGYCSMTGHWVSAAEAMHNEAHTKLPRFDGELLFDEVTRAEYAQDYGQIVHERPLAVLRPGSVEDIARLVKFARKFDLQIAARGHGHQPFGQAQVAGGIVIDMSSLRSVRAAAEDRIDADAGAQWRDVVHAAMSQGRTPPVLTNYLGLTVGGTLAIGGVGLASAHHGAQVDQVVALQVVTGRGDIVSCSMRRHRELFEAALAGQGQCAIITRATLRLKRAPSMIREYALPYADLATLLRDGSMLTQDGRFDGAAAGLLAAGGEWKYLLTATRYFDAPDQPNDAALLADLRFVRGAEAIRDVDYLSYVDVTPNFDPAQAHADLGLCIPESAVATFLGDALARLTPSDLGAATGIRLYFWKRELFRRPLLRLPNEERCCYAAILRAQTSDAATIGQMLAGNRVLFEQNRELGGTLYPFAALEMSHSDWRRHYRERWHALIESKRRFDPDRVFASGPNLEMHA